MIENVLDDLQRRQSAAAPEGDPDEQEGFEAGALGAAVGDLTDEEAAALLAQVEAQVHQQQATLQTTLDGLSQTLVTRRTEFVSGRQALGIEDEWHEDEEAYEGIDDANRGEEARFRVRKPAQGGGNTSTSGGATTGIRSKVFLNITAAYVDAAAGRIADMLLPTDDRSFALDHTPLPDAPDEAGAPMQQAQMAAGMTPVGADGQPIPQTALSQADPWKKAKEDESRRAQNAQDQIDDWLTECNWHKELRLVLKDAARIGTGVLKGPFPVVRKRKVWVGEGAERRLEVRDEIVPISKRISPWDFFPDPACGEDIQKGSGTFERDRIGPKTLAGLRGNPDSGYFDFQIEQCLREGPAQHVMEGRIDIPRDAAIDKQQFEIWHFYGVLERKDLEVLGVDLSDVTEPSGEESAVYLPVQVSIVNGRVIRVALNPLDTGDYPYDVMPWSRREGMVYGKGVARKIRTPQRMINGATRNMLDNASLSAGLILLLRKAGLTPTDGNWELHGRKVFLVDDLKAGVDDAKKGIASVDIPSRTNELMTIIEFALRMAEQVTGLPMLLQGHQGRAPDTLGVTQMLQNNANGQLRDHAKGFDDNITEPHITRYNDWLQQYTDDDEMHGLFKIDARGSSALVERELQNQWIAGMAAYVKDPAFKINPAKWFEEFSKSVRFDPKRIQYTDEEWEKIQSQPPPKPYQVDVAEVNKAARLETEQARGQNAIKQAAIAILADREMSDADMRARMLELLTTDRRERDLFTAQRAVKDKHGESVDMPG